MWGVPRASYTCTATVAVAPAVAVASRLVLVPKLVVARGARSTPGGTTMSVGAPVVTIFPVVGSTPVKPCTASPSGVTSFP